MTNGKQKAKPTTKRRTATPAMRTATPAVEQTPKKMSLESKNIAAQKEAELAALLKTKFPELVRDGRVNFDELKRNLGEEVEVSNERFGLKWHGKAERMRIIQQPSIATLNPAREESVDFDKSENLFIEGDNLEVLKLLQRAYFGKVKMIYIDPPYNTGKEFIYPDNYKETLGTYLKYTGQVDANGSKFSTNTETTGRYHSNWLNMMYPRLYLARNLLRDDGVIFISIDDNEQANLKALCDEVLGEENFVANYIWKARSGKDHTAKHVSVNHESIVCYSKNHDSLELAMDVRTQSGGNYSDSCGNYSREQIRQWGTNDRRIDRPTMFYPVSAPDGSEIFPMKENGEEGCWRISKSRMENLLKSKEVDFVYDEEIKKWNIYAKKYDGKRTKTAYSSLLDSFGTSANGTKEFKDMFGEKIFDTIKPINLIKHLVYLSGSQSNDIILDFFAGSCTTAHAVMQLNAEDGGNRKYICVQLPEPTGKDSEALKAGYKNIADIGKERIRRAAKKITAEQAEDKDKLDFGFKVFKLTPSNFKVWEGGVKQNLQQQLPNHTEHLEKSATVDDVFYELLLKSGEQLTAPVEKIKMAEKDVFSINDGKLLICLDKSLNQAVIDAMAEAAPHRVICLDAGFKGDDQLKTNAVHTFNNRAKQEQREVVFMTV